ncbi:MAG: hypothetical protein Q7R83_01355 [bacterium]|nr:hypothetical protein [bacterium]
MASLIIHFILGMAIAAVGAFFVLYTKTIDEFFGTVAWAEAKIGPGGTRLFYKLLGIIITLVGFIVAFNLWDAFLLATLGKIFPRTR